ncbi:hypothetical protein [Streptomyces sp. NPDC096339]|uniref:hypothetical protein n=1 Tax=Streptomyces sp. NPDC096339 TaxID=3366086 RepID=UPI003827673C
MTALQTRVGTPEAASSPGSAARDLRELQRIADAGYDGAGNGLDRLLRAPADGQRQ